MNESYSDSLCVSDAVQASSEHNQTMPEEYLFFRTDKIYGVLHRENCLHTSAKSTNVIDISIDSNECIALSSDSSVPLTIQLGLDNLGVLRPQEMFVVHNDPHKVLRVHGTNLPKEIKITYHKLFPESEVIGEINVYPHDTNQIQCNGPVMFLDMTFDKSDGTVILYYNYDEYYRFQSQKHMTRVYLKPWYVKHRQELPTHIMENTLDTTAIEKLQLVTLDCRLTEIYYGGYTTFMEDGRCLKSHSVSSMTPVHK